MNNIEILEEFIKYFEAEATQRKYRRNISITVGEDDIEAIENLIQENKELKEENKSIIQKSEDLIVGRDIVIQQNRKEILDYVKENYISKSKLKEKIKELEKLQENNRKDMEQAINFLNFNQIDKVSSAIIVNMSVRDILKQLLEDGE